MYKYKNIIVRNFQFTDEEFPGHGGAEFEARDCKNFFYKNEYYVYDDAWVNLGKEEQKDKWSTTHSDQQIVMFNWMLKNPLEIYLIDYWNESPFWFYHDCRHAEKDVHGGEVFVTAGIEEERLWEAGDLMVEKGLWHSMTTDIDVFLQRISDEMRLRWNGYYFSPVHAIDKLGIYKEEDEYEEAY